MNAILLIKLHTEMRRLDIQGGQPVDRFDGKRKRRIVHIYKQTFFSYPDLMESEDMEQRGNWFYEGLYTVWKELAVVHFHQLIFHSLKAAVSISSATSAHQFTLSVLALIVS